MQRASKKELLEGQFVKAIIGPHAGLRYSGPNAAWAYVNIMPHQYDRIVILGPSHKIGMTFATSTECDEWETPLGNLKVDKTAISNLL